MTANEKSASFLSGPRISPRAITGKETAAKLIDQVRGLDRLDRRRFTGAWPPTLPDKARGQGK